MRINFIFSLLAFLPSLITFQGSAQDLRPEIIFPDPGNDCILQGLSDNGKLAVHGSSIVDLTTTPFTFTTIGGSCRDISDDGKTVVGTNGGSPAVWKEATGWQRLPVPEGSRGGTALKVTPDGRYAVGLVNLGVVNSSDGCLWDLETLSLIELPGRPTEDRSAGTNDPNTYQNQYDNISPDGRYVQGTLGWSYLGYQTPYVYDRQTGETRYIGFKKDDNGKIVPIEDCIHYTECEGMSPDGHYITGPIYLLKGNEYLAAYRYDVWNDILEYYDVEDQADAWGFSVTNDGLVFLRKTAHNPYSEGYVCYDGFFYSIHDILTIGYGINLNHYNIDNTGAPVLCSADGRVVQLINSPVSSYILKFKEDIREVCNRMEILGTWTSSPRAGSVMSRLSTVTVEFAYPVEVTPEDYTKVELLDNEGKLLTTPLSGGGYIAKGNKVTITFRPYLLEPGKDYTVRIPEGLCRVKGLPSKTNREIRITYTGRREGPVAVTSIKPADGAELGSLDLEENPILLTYDCSVKINTSLTETPGIYMDDTPEPVAVLYAGLFNETTLALFPANKLNLYNGSVYRVTVPAGTVTDISGNGPSEYIEITYTGNFTPEMGDDQYIFRSTCDNWDNFLFYEGDHGEPVAEYADMGFTADTTPWWVVRDNAYSTDMAFASHSCYTDHRQADDWVVTRQLYIPDETVCLDFDGQSYRKGKKDILRIYVFPYEEIMNSLTKATVDRIRTEGNLVFEEQLDPGNTEGGIDGEWTHYVVPLAEYAGKNIYIAFVNQNCDQSLVMIDNIEVSRTVDAFVTLTNSMNVVNKEEIEIKGFLAIANELDEYNSISLELLDSEGNTVSTIQESGLALRHGDTYHFTFTQPLPLLAGEENAFTIEYNLDGKNDMYTSVIRNLIFEPVKRVVLEEFTGRDCQFCPQGFAMIERLGEMFPSNFIPIGLYCYNGTDPKGVSVMDYWSYLGMTAAPSGRINRRPTSMSLVFSSELDRYVYSATQLPGAGEIEIPLWYDEVVAELAEPAYIDVNITTESKDNSQLAYTAEIKSALNLEGQNLRVFGVLLENGLQDYQTNGVYETEDILLGDWGKGGKYGSGKVYTTFDHAAKATWGLTYNGTGNLLPGTMRAGEIYTVDIDMPVPSSVINVDNCDFVVMIIDGNTGRVINASTTAMPSGIEYSALSQTDIKLTASNGSVIVSANIPTNVRAYSTSGLLLGSASGEGSFTLETGGYRGVIIIKATNSDGAITSKLLLQ